MAWSTRPRRLWLIRRNERHAQWQDERHGAVARLLGGDGPRRRSDRWQHSVMESYVADAKSFHESGTFTTGTGKYAGISGSWTFVGHGPQFRTATEGTYVPYGPIQGS